jgi:hypothetical protein
MPTRSHAGVHRCNYREAGVGAVDQSDERRRHHHRHEPDLFGCRQRCFARRRRRRRHDAQHVKSIPGRDQAKISSTTTVCECECECAK